MSGLRLDVVAVSRRADDLGPWSAEHIGRAVMLNGLGLLLVCVSWFQAAGEFTVRGQLTWLNVGLLGLGVCGVANGTLLYRGRRSVGIVRQNLLPDVPREHAIPARVTHEEHVLVARHPGAMSFHRPACAFAAGRPVDRHRRSATELDGLVPCEVCEP